VVNLASAESRASTRAPIWPGVLSGVVAAAAGLAAAELVAAASRSLASPMAVLGDRFIDQVPAWLKDLAIALFGTYNKTALMAGMSVVIAVIAAIVGVRTFRHGLRAAVWVVSAAVVLAMLAAWRSPDGRWWHGLPAVVAGAVTLGILRSLLRRSSTHGVQTSTSADGPAPMGVDRRRLLLGSLGIGVGAVAVGGIGRALQRRFSNAADRAALVLPRARTPLGALPADPARSVAGLSPLYTPNDRFFRIDTAFVVPSVALDDWSLRIHGMVERELRFTFAELLAEPMVEADVTLSCVSNEVGGNLVGTARWLGVRLDDLLARVGVRPEADQIVGRSVDGFTAGFPVSALDGRDALVAVGMNGEPLPQRHGFPARLVVPGLYGYVSATKWLSEIELTRFDQFEGYWIPRGWAREAAVKTQSRIDRPSGNVTAERATPIAGVAWAPNRGIAAVEVQVDDGPWRAATLGPGIGDDGWVQWWIDWDPTPGEHRVRCRATDGNGETQVEERTPVAPDGATGWHTRRITVGP
jgi:DMSO/TMAO reductase YedYZ molybdopterin-dependent catalytic subunit